MYPEFAPRLACRLAVATIALWPTLAAAQTDVRAVTLSTSGVALIEGTVPMRSASAQLSVRRDSIDDFLKSLWLSDPSGGPLEVRLAGPGALEDAFAGLPFGPADLSDPARLMAVTQGETVVVTRRGTELRGRNLGVAERACEHGACPHLTLQERDGSLRQIELDSATAVRFADPGLQTRLERGIAALQAGVDSGALDITLTSGTAGNRDIGLMYLQSVPLWRTAWRAVETSGGLQLTGWAVIENTTGSDWDTVELSLATGAVTALQARLYARTRVTRDMARPEFDGPAFARTLGAMAAPEMALADSAAPEPPRMEDAQSFSRYTLPAPVTLAAGQMLTLPFVQETLPQARALRYRGGSGARHPEIVLEVENPLPLRLPAGVLTLYEGARGHAGDAMVPELPPGGAASLAFARDTAIEVREDQATTEELRSLRIVDGVMELREDLVRRTTYRITGAADGARQVTLEHPRSDGWQVVTEGGETRPDVTRWRAEVAAGQELALEILEQRPRARRIAVADLDDDGLIYWERSAPDAEAQALLAEVRRLRGAIAEQSAIATRARADADGRIAEQRRLVDLIVALGDDSAANRDRRARVDALDAEIGALHDTVRDAEDRAAALRDSLRDLVGG